MSKKCQKEIKRQTNNKSAVKNLKKAINGQKSILNSVIGPANVNRWCKLKTKLLCKSNEVFVKLLLDLAEKHADSLTNNHEEIKEDISTTTIDNFIEFGNASKKQDVTEVPVAGNNLKNSVPEKNLKSEKNEKTLVIETHPKSTKENTKSKSPISETNTKSLKTQKINSTVNINIPKELPVPLEINSKFETNDLNKKIEKSLDFTLTPSNNINKLTKKIKPVEYLEKKVKKVEYDVRKAPELNTQTDKLISSLLNDDKIKSTKLDLCSNCGNHHLKDQCPLIKPQFEIFDSIDKTHWIDKYKEQFEQFAAANKLNDDETDKNATNKFSFAYLSLPEQLYFEETSAPHGIGVFAKHELQEFTQFGPLQGKIIKEVDIPEDCSMRDLFEINDEKANIYVTTENLDESNWLRFVRPAPTREARNLFVATKNNHLFFISTKIISPTEELLYWQDDTVATNKKKMEKTTCGGCNMTFQHPLYYRTHCSVFHDVRYSLTIRKYHCKICGAAVLGKENIMKHATELHNGQGAYQCQFCKKFFLRLNYLEMHRTYGCSANPHRSRPLCDFCGRKFCQPQKLKVHIKRMHSDLSEVLKEFQCKNCLKILGSRAALQRHLKEVHNKQVDGACACSRCGKLFQNKSNLKIHMLTHSGIKPFKCAEKSCAAAFTTKQCLQFHYKKVHSYTEDMMPKIERSVDYTFEAYSGNDDIIEGEGDENMRDSLSDQEDSSNCVDDKNVDDPPALCSPLPIESNDPIQNSNPSPPVLEAYVKILSKGSKKWIGDTPLMRSFPDLKNAQLTNKIKENKEEENKLTTTLNSFNRHESSNATLLVEAALDSVCNEPNIDIDVNTTSNCTDTLVNNLYTLSHNDTLPDYNHSVDVNDSRDINLISPSVNDQISVTDDLNDELHQTQNMGIDYSSFHQEDFSPPASPSRNNFVRDYINSPQNAHSTYENSKSTSPSASPQKYDFNAAINPESDDSNGIGAQNLSLHNPKDNNIQLDLSIYKSHYSFDNTSFFRKDFRSKFEEDRKQLFILDPDKNYAGHMEAPHENLDITEKDFDNLTETKHKDIDLDLPLRGNLNDFRNKFELDLDLRKTYDIDSEIRRSAYETSLDDFRIKNYDLDSLDIRTNMERNKTYENLMDDFRTDRNFEPLVLNPSELQGLDMSARSYHNYSNLNRYHHLYPEVERPNVDLRLNYSPPPAYSHPDILRVVSLDLTPPGRHSVDLSLRSHQLANSRLLGEHSLSSTTHRLSLDQPRLLGSDLITPRHLSSDSRLISDMSSRILSDHTTNRILSNEQIPSNRLLSTDQRVITDETRIISEQPRLLDQTRLLGDGRILPSVSTNGSISPVPYTSYSVSPSPYHPTALPPRPHATSPTPPSYHHYSSYY